MFASDITAAASPYKRCPCGLEYTRAEWRRLPLKGVQQLPGESIALELRDCPCGSTIAIEVPADIATLTELHTATARKACMLMAHEGRSERFVETMAEVDAIADQIREARDPQPPLPGSDERCVGEVGIDGIKADTWYRANNGKLEVAP